ncbi:MAG: hypothetical protein KAU03_06330 [Candidatus Altiarchaeales archaeon]|nr:hypothetical protein [Candidatus Altiarchaeales archaeon]
MNFILETGVGFWNPVVFLAGFLILLLISYLIWSIGEKGYGKGVQREAFFSGGLPPGERIQAKNLYWGFMEALKGYYGWAINLHTGIVNDYVAWFIALMAIILILINLWGA